MGFLVTYILFEFKNMWRISRLYRLKIRYFLAVDMDFRILHNLVQLLVKRRY